MENVKRIDFVVGAANSDGKLVEGTERGVTVLFNTTVVSVDEVNALIRSDEYEDDKRLVVTTPVRADNLWGQMAPR